MTDRVYTKHSELVEVLYGSLEGVTCRGCNSKRKNSILKAQLCERARFWEWKKFWVVGGDEKRLG